MNSKLKKWSFYLLVLLFGSSLSSCKMIKTLRLFKNEKIEFTGEKEIIPIEFQNEIPFVKVEIGGEIHRFIFDTGALTVISPEIYSKLGLKPKVTQKTTDSQKATAEIILTKLPEMKVGNVIFKNSATAVIDLKEHKELACYGFSGILGANQMANAFWKVDYENETLEVYKKLENIDLSDFEVTIPFKNGLQKTPIVESKINDTTFSFVFDTGSNGGFSLNTLPTSVDSLDIENTILQTGIGSAGVFGVGKITNTYIFRSDTVQLGDLTLNDEVISTAASSTIGNKFLQNYTFVLDWENKNVYMHQIKERDKTFKSFGFSYHFIENTAKVAYVFPNENLPLQVGDTILEINKSSLQNLSSDEICEKIRNKIDETADKLEVVLKNGSRNREVVIRKKEFFIR